MRSLPLRNSDAPDILHPKSLATLSFYNPHNTQNYGLANVPQINC